ncbi:MAG: dihydroorotase family protein [Nitrososphaeraceae archaeon]|nr:dihydroorotase family protein [Nitrososphaeraceae archaeon]
MQNSCDLVIKDGHIVIPKVGIIQTNILIENGKIKNLSKNIEHISSDKTIDASNKFVLPGLIDPHVHYGVYSPVQQAAKTESRSAAIGGITTIIRMLRLDSRYKHSITKQLEASLNNHYVDFTMHPSILQQGHLEDVNFLNKKIGINSFKLYMNLGSGLNHIHVDLNPDENKVRSGNVDITDEFLERIVKTITFDFNNLLLVHAEDPHLCYEMIQKEIVNKQTLSNKVTNLSHIDSDSKKEQSSNQNLLELWSKCRPFESEINSIKKISKLARKYKSKIYFVHIGSSAAIDAIIAEREKGGCNLYIETCPHYLTHTYEYANLKGKVVPPLRSKHDVQSIWYALRNGIIDTIGTDHVANQLSIKIAKENPLLNSLSGFPGLATMLPVLLSEGVNKGRLTLENVAEVSSYNTSRIFNMYPQKGTIQTGSDADLVIVDLDMRKKVTPEILQSHSDYTIYDGWEFQGWPIMTISRGKIIAENLIVNEQLLGHGKFIPRFS